jgi:hypothetical protein
LSAYQPKAGVVDGSNATAGQVGEFMTASVAAGSAVGLSNGVYGAAVVLNLTAGDWDVWGIVAFTGQSTTAINILRASVSASPTTMATVMAQMCGGGTVFAYGDPTFSVGPTRVSLTASASYYLTILGTFSGGTCSTYGSIMARRVR